MVDILIAVIIICLIPVILVGLCVAGAAAAAVIVLPIVLVADRIQDARQRRRFKAHQKERAERLNRETDASVPR